MPPELPKTSPIPDGCLFAQTGNLKALEELYKTDPLIALWPDEEGRTPLHYAAEYNQKEVAEWLVATHYMLVLTPDFAGILPIDSALHFRAQKVFAYLAVYHGHEFLFKQIVVILADPLFLNTAEVISPMRHKGDMDSFLESGKLESPKVAAPVAAAPFKAVAEGAEAGSEDTKPNYGAYV